MPGIESLRAASAGLELAAFNSQSTERIKMRKIEAKMVMAVRERLGADHADWKSGNTEVRTEFEGVQGTPGFEKNVCVYLHGYKIATFDAALQHARECRGLMVTDAGWKTVTTKSRLNALLDCFYCGVGICQKAGEWYLNTTEFCGMDWVSYGWKGDDSYACQRAEALA